MNIQLFPSLPPVLVGVEDIMKLSLLTLHPLWNIFFISKVGKHR